MKAPIRCVRVPLPVLAIAVHALLGPALLARAGGPFCTVASAKADVQASIDPGVQHFSTALSPPLLHTHSHPPRYAPLLSIAVTRYPR